ncbi:MAG: hypothetical protein WCI18_16980, partial [Pseudomonadota bacterium]
AGVRWNRSKKSVDFPTHSEASLEFLKSRKWDLIPVSRGISGFGEGYLDPELDLISNWTDYQNWMATKIRVFKRSITT